MKRTLKKGLKVFDTVCVEAFTRAPNDELIWLSFLVVNNRVL